MRVLLIENKNGTGKIQIQIIEDGERLPKSVRLGGDKCLIDMEVCSRKGSRKQRVAEATLNLGIRYGHRIAQKVLSTT